MEHLLSAAGRPGGPGASALSKAGTKPVDNVLAPQLSPRPGQPVQDTGTSCGDDHFPHEVRLGDAEAQRRKKRRPLNPAEALRRQREQRAHRGARKERKRKADKLAAGRQPDHAAKSDSAKEASPERDFRPGLKPAFSPHFSAPPGEAEERRRVEDVDEQKQQQGAEDRRRSPGAD